MSSRGVFIKNGHVTSKEYKTVKKIYDAEVLEGQKYAHSLPDYSLKPNKIYIKETKGEFRELRVYNEEGKAFLEIAYHGEKSLTGSRTSRVLHYHMIDENFRRSKAFLVTSEIYAVYKKYLEVYGL